MSEPQTISINGVKYVRADSVPQHLPMTKKQIIVADRGWVFVGDVEDNDNGTVTIQNCKNIRKWGTIKGLGELTDGPTKDTVVDDYGVVVVTPIARIRVNSGW